MLSLVRPAARAVAHRAPERLVSRILSQERLNASSFGTFRCADGSNVALLDGYRDRIKSRWRGTWWPVGTLLALDANDRVELSEELVEAAARIRAARTMPISPEDVARILQTLFVKHPEWFSVPVRMDPRYGMKVLEPIVGSDPPVDVHRRGAEELRQIAAEFSIDLRVSRVLDVGCGAGYQSFALAGIAGETVGIDINVDLQDLPARRERMRLALLEDVDDARVRLETGDVTDLRFDDCSFDLVVSNVVLEHVRDLPRAFAEIRRVLRPGGLSVNGVQPWFGPDGGHSLCTLDFPWGHVRLSEEEFADYVAAWRPLEAADAVRRHRTGFQQPRHTLDRSRAAAVTAGLSIIRWEETRIGLRDAHCGLATEDLLADCRRVHPDVTKRDLLTIGYRAVLRRALR